MRKILFLFGVMCITLFSSCNKCSNSTSYADKIEYSLNLDGQTDGLIDVSYKTIEFVADGTADIKFRMQSDSMLRFKKSDISLEKALASNDVNCHEAALKVANDLDNLKVTSARGTYYIHIIGRAKEPITGLIFDIDRTFTNRPQ